MKKVLLAMGVSMILAGTATAQVSYGLRAGLNLGQIANLSDRQSNNTSFHVTGFADFPVAPQFSIQPGLSLQGKGTRFHDDQTVSNVSTEITRTTMSLEIPVNAVYYIPTGYAGSLFLGAGPYVGFNLSGRDKWTVASNVGESSTDRSLSFSGDNRDMNVIDAGVNFLAGYRFSNGLLFNAGYGLGLTNLVPESRNTTYANRVWSFGVGFQF